MRSAERSKRRTCFASPSSEGSKPSNATGTRSAPRAPLDTFRGAWYTAGVGSTTTADIHHHSTAESYALGRSVSRLRRTLARFWRALTGRRSVDLVWTWRQVYRAAGLDAARVRLVWRRGFREGYSGLAYLEGAGYAEVNALAMRSTGEVVLTALHEIVHLRQDRARHDRTFLRDLRRLVGALVDVPGPTRARRSEIEAYEDAVAAKIDAARPSNPRRVRWRRA